MASRSARQRASAARRDHAASEVPLGHAHAARGIAPREAHLAVAREHHLGRAAADVDHRDVADGRDVGGDAGEGQRSPPPPRSARAARTRGARSARAARRGSRRRARRSSRLRSAARRRAPRLARGSRRAQSSTRPTRRRLSDPLASTPSPSRVISSSRSTSLTHRRATSAIRSRVELLPRSATATRITRARACRIARDRLSGAHALGGSRESSRARSTRLIPVAASAAELPRAAGATRIDRSREHDADPASTASSADDGRGEQHARSIRPLPSPQASAIVPSPTRGGAVR